MTSRHYEVCKYYSLDEHTSLPDDLVMGTKFWNTLSSEQKEWMNVAAKNSVIAQKKFWNDNVEECMKILKEAGVEIIRPDKSVFAEKSKGLLIEIEKQAAMKNIIAQIQSQ